MNVLVKLGGINMYVNTVPCIFTMFIPAIFFYYKSVFSQFRLGHENFFVRLDGL
jgi:hypothetical protein